MGSTVPRINAAAADELPVRLGEVIGGKYRVDRVLGVGGMGAVVQAHHLVLDQPVALKFMLPIAARNKDASERFLREARAAVRLQGENVCRVFDVGTLPSDEPYMVMELLDGEDLAQVIQTRGRIPTAEAIDYIRQACRALAEAHALGIVHRDLKPRNLFLAKRVGGPSVVKVLDFGISKIGGEAAERSITSTNTMLGTPHYMAPEQMLSTKHVDARADVWSLGVCLYELLSGAVPFEGDTLAQLTIRVCQEPPRHINAIAPWVPAPVAAIVHQCLEKNVEQRVPSAAALSEALRVAGAIAVESQRELESARTLDAPAPRFVDGGTGGAMSTSTIEPPRSGARFASSVVVACACVVVLGVVAGGVLYARGKRSDATGGDPARGASASAPVTASVEPPASASSTPTNAPGPTSHPSATASASAAASVAPPAKTAEPRRPAGTRPRPQSAPSKPSPVSDLPTER